MREHLITWGNRVERNCVFLWIWFCPWQWMLKFKMHSHISYILGPSFLALHFLGIKENENLLRYLLHNSVVKFEDWSINTFCYENFTNCPFFSYCTLFILIYHCHMIFFLMLHGIPFVWKVIQVPSPVCLSNFFLTVLVIPSIISSLY